MEELLELGTEDAAIGAAGREGTVEISGTVEAESPDEAITKGAGLIRTAIHAAGGHTPDWTVDWISVSARKADLVQA